VEIAHREAQALTALTEIEQVEVVLAQPQTFMNLSGLAVARLLDRYGLSVEDLIVLVDDVNLPLGCLRVRQRGSAGGHNGLKSIIGVLQSDEFARLRLGVKPGQPVEDLIAYVLSRFRKADLEVVAALLDQAVEAVRIILRERISAAMNRFNRRIASPHS